MATNVSAALPEDHPDMIAWRLYKDSADYRNTRRWAVDPNHVEGSLWAAFLAGRHSVLADTGTS